MSNRQQRRHRAHTVKVPDGKVLHAEVLTSTGETAEVSNLARMPAKRPGFHRWQAFVVHHLSDDQAQALTEGGGKVLFDQSSVVMMPVAYCVDCEGTYADVSRKRCPAGDEWRNPE